MEYRCSKPPFRPRDRPISVLPETPGINVKFVVLIMQNRGYLKRLAASLTTGSLYINQTAREYQEPVPLGLSKCDHKLRGARYIASLKSINRRSQVDRVWMTTVVGGASGSDPHSKHEVGKHYICLPAGLLRLLVHRVINFRPVEI